MPKFKVRILSVVPKEDGSVPDMRQMELIKEGLKTAHHRPGDKDHWVIQGWDIIATDMSIEEGQEILLSVGMRENPIGNRLPTQFFTPTTRRFRCG